MAKAVLISIRPKWVEKILSEEKTLEVRKTRPTLETPFRCYIYCTNSGVSAGMWGKHGKVVGEFVCDAILPIQIECSCPSAFWPGVEGVEFAGTCLTDKEILRYLGNGKQGYAWHISGLKVYGTPKKPSEFKGLCKVPVDCGDCPYYNYTKMACCGRTVNRPPQSWMYVEELING